MVSEESAQVLRRIAQRFNADHDAIAQARKLAFLKEFYQPKPSRLTWFRTVPATQNGGDNMSEQTPQVKPHCAEVEDAREECLLAQLRQKNPARPHATPTHAAVEHG